MYTAPPVSTERVTTEDTAMEYGELYGMRGFEVDIDVSMPFHHVSADSHFPTEVQNGTATLVLV